MSRALGPIRAPTEPSCSASTGCRSSISRIRISRCGGGRRRGPIATCWCSTARSTTISSCATNWPPGTAPFSPPRVTARPSSPAITTGAPRCWRGCAACSRSRCGTPSPASCCARDPFGIKPLFMATGTGGTAVASEKKCLMDLAGLVGFDTSIDRRAVQHYTVLQYVPEPETLHRGVRRLESGCYARISPGLQPEVARYFVPRFAATPITQDTEQARYDEITAVLEDSVAKHMRADVTVGAFLSGGIDSTAIAALAIRHNPRLITFTTGFEREGFSEIDVAVASAEAIGARHVAKVVSPDEFVAALPEIVWYLDEPVADPALVPLFFVAREARKHVKVVLSGEGADELFGGYTIYREPLSLKPFDYLPGPLRRSMGKVSTPLPEGMRGKSLLHRGSLTLA